MKKIIYSIFLLTIFFLIALTLVLSTIGVKTDKFNSLISKTINQSNNLINLELNSITFKLDLKQISLFLETQNPQIIYRGTSIPAKNIKAYIDFASIIKTNLQIKKVTMDLKQIDVDRLQEISSSFKPSNFKSFINNKVQEGKLNIELELYLNKGNFLDDFIARGSVSDFRSEITKKIYLDNSNFNFFADKTDVLIKNINSSSDSLEIIDGDLKIKLNQEISIESNFKTKIKYNDKIIRDLEFNQNLEFLNNLTNLEAEINNRFLINFDETYKIKDYDYQSNGKIFKADLFFKKPIEQNYLNYKIKQMSFSDSEIITTLNSKKKSTYISGKYSLNTSKFLPFESKNLFNEDYFKTQIRANYDELISLKFLNYEKPKIRPAEIILDFEKQKKNININKLKIVDGENLISVEGIKLKNSKFNTLKSISVKTNKNGIKNNDFTILYGKKILIRGSNFDASNLAKFINLKNNKNKFLNINKEIEIDFKNIIAPLSEKINNFKLLGKIEKGQLIKISSKGDFGGGNFLDISMKNDKRHNKQYLEIYSDLPRPLLTEFSFFKGLTGGNLLYSSIIEGNNSNSKLKIENFKVVNAPGLIKLLSLADLGGLADLAEGEGLSFDILEIDMEKKADTLQLREILALGPSISVLMEGYKDPKITSIRGTLVPAKTLNKLISKIPLIGDIVIPKEAGEGLFGISFKMKGPPGKIKTTINPIKTLTPRFIQKILERKKN